MQRKLISFLLSLTLLISFASVVAAENSAQPLGDVNGDGSINAVDATRVLLCAVDKVTLSDEQLSAADVNGDEKVNAADATLILLHTVGKKLIEDESGSTSTEPTTTTTTTTVEKTKVTVPEPVYNEEKGREVLTIFPEFCIVVLTPEQVALNETITPDYFPDVTVEAVGFEVGSTDRVYLKLYCPTYAEMGRAVERIQDYDFVQTVEFIPMNLEDMRIDPWSNWYSHKHIWIVSEQPLTQADFSGEGVVKALIPLDYVGDGEYPYSYWAFLKEDGDASDWEFCVTLSYVATTIYPY